MPRTLPRKTAIERRLVRLTGTALGKLRVRNACAAVFLLGGREMRRLKAKYAKKRSRKAAKRALKLVSYPDVLAFPEPAGFPHPETRKRLLGEVYINAEIAERDPRRAAYLLVHGIFHLLGYTHGRKDDTLRMQREEKALLKQIRN